MINLKNFPFSLRCPSPIEVLAVAAVMLMVLPWLNPFAPGPSPAVVPLLFSWICGAILLIVVGVWAPQNLSGSLARTMAMAWLVAGLLSGVIGLLQYFGAAGSLSPWVNQTRFGEAFANLRQRNQFATLTSIALAALVWVAHQCRLPNEFAKLSSRRMAWLVMAAGCLLAVGNAVSSSRTGLLQLLLLCGLWIVWGDWSLAWLKRLLLVLLVAYVSAMFAAPFIAGLELSTHGALARMGSDEPCASRLVLWSNVLHLIAQKPWLGWGWGELDYAHFITLYNGPRFCDILDNAHNLPLHLAVELGVPAALLICGGFLWWAVRQKPWAERDRTRQMAWAVMAVILLHSMLEYPLWYGPFQMAFGACVMLLWREKHPAERKNNSKKASNWPLARVLWTQAAIISIAFIGYAAWDYHRISQIYLPPESRAAAYRTDTLDKIRSSWLFADQVQFAELLTTPLTLANAVWTFNAAGHLLHYSPEPRVVEKLIESAVMLGKEDDALAYLARYQAAFPAEYEKWSKANQSAVKN